MVEKVILISCAKTKRNTPSAAKDLYQSDLFRSMRRYAEENADTWYILSAKHGVLQPDTIIDPYEKTLNQMTKPETKAVSAMYQPHNLGANLQRYAARNA